MSSKKSRRLSPAEEGEAAARRENYQPKSDELNPRFIFSGTHTDLLVSAANGVLDLVQLAKNELANRGLGLTGEWVGFKEAAKIAEGAPSSLAVKTRRTVCPACDGRGRLISGKSAFKVYRCSECAGIFSDNISMTEMQKYVKTNEWEEDANIGESEDLRYFDFSFRDANGDRCRIHGWFNFKSKKVVQIG